MPTFSTLYDTVKAKLSAIEPTASFEVTHYTLSLGAADAVTGQFAKSFSAGSTIEMLMVSKAAAHLLYGSGYYVKSDVLGFTETAVSEGDKIKQTIAAVDYYYIVESCVPQQVGDLIVFYTANLTYMGDFING